MLPETYTKDTEEARLNTLLRQWLPYKNQTNTTKGNGKEACQQAKTSCDLLKDFGPIRHPRDLRESQILYIYVLSIDHLHAPAYPVTSYMPYR
jgi:hypothetical protein